MKKILILNLTIILLFSCNQFKSKDYEEENLKGRVKSVKHQKFDAVEKFGEVVKSTSADSDEKDDYDILSNSLIQFNEKGGITNIINYTRDGELKNKLELEELTFNFYNNSGNLFLVMKPDNRETPKEINTYTASGDLIEKTKFTYNEKNKVIEEKTYDSSGELIRTVKNSYKDDLLASQSISEREESFWGYGEFIEISKSFEFNDNKDIIKQEITKNGKVTTHTYKYELDENKNWISKIQFTNNKPASIVEREIVYF